MKRLVFIGVALAAAYFGGVESGLIPRSQQADVVSVGRADQILAEAFENQRSNIQVQGAGKVSRVLADDNDGSRHQRFLVQLASGQTLLIAHNIDLASRVAALKVGDAIEFYGEYEWNAKGGVIHWTHRDPRGSHAHGWIRHNGRTYQ